MFLDFFMTNNSHRDLSRIKHNISQLLKYSGSRNTKLHMGTNSVETHFYNNSHDHDITCFCIFNPTPGIYLFFIKQTYHAKYKLLVKGAVKSTPMSSNLCFLHINTIRYISKMQQQIAYGHKYHFRQKNTIFNLIHINKAHFCKNNHNQTHFKTTLITK